LCLALGCPRGQGSYHSVTWQGGSVKSTKAQAPTGAPIAIFDRRIQLWRAQVEPAEASPGETVTLHLWFVAQRDLFDDWQVFVHGQVAGGELNQVQDDHLPLEGNYPTSRWRQGDIVEEQRRIPIPAGLVGRSLTFYVGFYSGERRLPVDDPGKSPQGDQVSAHDGHHRVPAARLLLRGGVDELTATVYRTPGAIALDGKLDEPAWAQAQRLGPFVNYDGVGVPSNTTLARLSYDDQALYLAFECADRDIWTSFQKRDDPIYNEEAVEIFLDVDGDLKTYVELQQSPANVHFDAAFTGRRQGMDTGYNADYQTALLLDGTLNDPSDVDRGWTAEWRIPFDQIRGLDKPARAGDVWRFNLFRLDKPRQGGRIVDNQASAWSSPLSGDFHNVNRFGRMVFAEAPPAP
ncbi:MAG: carbohydrate-binding family 9-like protein, partial [Deltaproteobacteria bacterium]|nr:carbohydrate-binding family 9-like protein [Deltaproteobacteria bacterium]